MTETQGGGAENSTADELSLVELRRAIDHQKELRDTIETQAWRLFRLILPTISILVASVSLVLSRFGFSFYFPDIDISSAIVELYRSSISYAAADLPLGEPQGSLISAFLFLMAYMLLLSGSLSLGLVVPTQLFKIMGPRYYRSTPEIEGFVAGPGGQKAAISEYRELHESNQENLDEMKDLWTECYETLKTGTQHLLVGLLVVIALFASRNGITLLFVATAVAVYGIRHVHYVISPEYTKVKDYLIWDKYLDTSLGFIVVAYIIDNLLPIDGIIRGILLLGILLSLLVYVIRSGFLSYDRIEPYLHRNVVFLLGCFLVLAIFYQGTHYQFPSDSHTVSVLTSAVLWPVLATIVSLFVQIVIRLLKTLHQLGAIINRYARERYDVIF